MPMQRSKAINLSNMETKIKEGVFITFSGIAAICCASTLVASGEKVLFVNASLLLVCLIMCLITKK